MTEKSGQAQPDKKAAAESSSAAEVVDAAEAGTPEGDAVLVDPYPAYEELPLKELRSVAKARGVFINRDVEKAELVKVLRGEDPGLAYDLLPLEDLRKKAGELGVVLPEEFERAHLVTELRAADTHTG